MQKQTMKVTRRCRCEVAWKVDVPCVGVRNWKSGKVCLPTIETILRWRYCQTMGGRRPQPCLDGTLARRVKHDCGYPGAVPLMAWYVRTASLLEMRSGTRSQWRLMRASVICSDRRIRKSNRQQRSKRTGDTWCKQEVQIRHCCSSPTMIGPARLSLTGTP